MEWRKIWKLFWDILATVVGLYLGYKVFMYCGERIPAFGYFPIGLIVGGVVLVIGAKAMYLGDLLFSWILFKLFKVRTQSDLPF